MVIALSISIFILCFIAGISKTVCDLSETGKLKGNPLFWHKNIAWKNKWKNGDETQGEKFFGSSKWFVLFTDGWHLFQLIQWSSTLAIGLCVGFMAGKVNPFILFAAIPAYWLSRLFFHIFHDMTDILKVSSLKSKKW